MPGETPNRPLGTDLPEQVFLIQFRSPKYGIDWMTVQTAAYVLREEAAAMLERVRSQSDRDNWRLVVVPCSPEKAGLVQE